MNYITIPRDGRLYLNKEIQKESGIFGGEKVSLSFRKGEIRIISKAQALKDLQAWAIKIPGSSQDFLKWRKEDHEA